MPKVFYEAAEMQDVRYSAKQQPAESEEFRIPVLECVHKAEFSKSGQPILGRVRERETQIATVQS